MSGENEGPAVVLCEGWADLDKWRTLVEVRPEALYSPMNPGEPAVVVRQHVDTRELRVDIFDCSGGLNITYTNGGVDKACKGRASWFRELRTKIGSLRPIRVRFMCRGEPDNLRLKS